MNHWGIRRKVLMLALLPAALIATVLAFHFVSGRIDDLELALRNRGLAIARQLAPASEFGVFAGNREILRRLAEAARNEADVNWVAISDVNGGILASSGDNISLPEVSSPQTGSEVAVEDRRSAMVFSAPIYINQISVEDEWSGAVGETEPEATSKHVIGRVSVEMSRASTLALKNELLLNSTLITLAGLFISGLLAVRMSRDVTRPILRLADAARGIEEGRLGTRVPEESGGELQVLEKGLNAMANALEASHEHLQERIDEATERLSYHASHDALTGLINRREFEIRLERALRETLSGQQAYTLCYLDLDQFKVVNDTCGHVAGDELLRQLSTLLLSGLREQDTMGRLGGDEFGVLLEQCALDEAQVMAETIRQTVEGYRFVWQERSFAIGVSIGLVSINQDSGSLANLLGAADAACYAAKDLGRNRVHTYQAQDDELLRRRGEMQWITRIHRAMEENRFLLYMQPIMPVGLGSTMLPHFEVLLRMIDDDGQPVLPMAFIPAAERYNLMPAIDRWVIMNAFSHCRELAQAGVDTTGVCTINLSGHSLCDEKFFDFVEQQFELSEVPYNKICFEITETAAISKLKEAVAFMSRLKAKGVVFSLDDFGSGLSSFSYLKNLPVDYLKIDGAFVRDMAVDAMDRAMVESIHHIGRVMGLKTIAECVESEEAMELLRAIGVDYAQGEWLDMPKPLLAFGAGTAL